MKEEEKEHKYNNKNHHELITKDFRTNKIRAAENCPMAKKGKRKKISVPLSGRPTHLSCAIHNILNPLSYCFFFFGFSAGHCYEMLPISLVDVRNGFSF